MREKPLSGRTSGGARLIEHNTYHCVLQKLRLLCQILQPVWEAGPDRVCSPSSSCWSTFHWHQRYTHTCSYLLLNYCMTFELALLVVRPRPSQEWDYCGDGEEAEVGTLRREQHKQGETEGCSHVCIHTRLYVVCSYFQYVCMYVSFVVY